MFEDDVSVTSVIVYKDSRKESLRLRCIIMS